MKKYKRILKSSISFFQTALFAIIIMLAFGLFASARSQTTSGLGKYGASFLQISSSARQVAMGGAFTGIADDINLLRYNIGGLGTVEKTVLGINFNKWIDDTQQGAIGLAMPTRFGIFGVDLIYFNEGKILEFDENFTPTGSEVGSNDIALTLGIGSYKNIFNFNVSIGGALKVVRQTLADQSATALGLDFGFLIRTTHFSYGATVQNFGITKLKFISKEDPLPETYRGGVGFHFQLAKKIELNLAADMAWLTDQKVRTYSGAEIIINKRIAIRGGYKFHDFEVNRWGAGIGLIIPMKWAGGSNTRLDYSYSPLDAFESSAHRFSLLFAFGTMQEGAMSIETAEMISELADKLQRELEAAEKARQAAEEAERRTREMEKEMEARLARVHQIAKESKGQIEVHTETPSDSVWITMRINFDFDKANIRPDAFETMHRIAQILNTYPGAKVHISGHTDFIGTEEYNIRLSHRRIDSVITYLTTKEHVDPDRFFMPVGYGKQKPIASNATKEGRFMNRRVDFIIYTNNLKPPVPEGSAIKTVEIEDERTVKIICNGRVDYTHTFLSNPDRIVLDFPGIFLLTTEKAIKFDNPIFIRARLGYHPDDKFSRVVLDLRSPIRYRVETQDNIIYIRAL